MKKLSARGLVKRYKNVTIVNGVDLSVANNEIVGLLGANGAGKTTSFNMIIGLVRADEGEILLDDDDITELPMHLRARKGIGYLPQEHSVFRKLTTEQNILAVLEAAAKHDKETQHDICEKLMDEVGILKLRNKQTIQLSGGEPTVHPQLLEMIDVLIDRGFNQVCINTNGIKLAQEKFARRLADRFKDNNAKLFIYLQFDGFEETTHARLRGRGDLLALKQKALDNCQQLAINVHPVMTLTRDINEHEVGDFIDLVTHFPNLKNMVIQPAMYSGRYENGRRVDRLTLADTVDLICSQFGVFEPSDFMPIPCSDPNCFGMAVALRTGSGLIPISRYFPRYANWSDDESRQLIDKFTDTINGPDAMQEALQWVTSSKIFEQIDESVIDNLLDVLIEQQQSPESNALWDSLLVISIKPFMDAWTYDQDRIDQCCVHILDADGQPVSFCEFNAINRPRITTSAITTDVDTLPIGMAK